MPVNYHKRNKVWWLISLPVQFVQMATKRKTTPKTKAKPKTKASKAKLAPTPRGLFGSFWHELVSDERPILAVVLALLLVPLCAIGLTTTVIAQSRLSQASHVLVGINHVGGALTTTSRSIDALATDQQHAEINIVDINQLRDQLAQAKGSAYAGKRGAAQQQLKKINDQIVVARVKLSDVINERKRQAVKPAAAATAPVSGGVQLPILIYHEPPANFEQQLQHLIAAGYTTITMDQATAGLNGGSLPAKPVVITFDDGFSSQLSAFHLLQKYNQKATFYIITSGEASRWCVGSGRHYNDPVQPPGGCGDSYMSWDEVRTLDRSGLIEIAGHTVNHRNLASLSADEQRYEILGGKQQLEAQIGHTVRSLAYPYGAYNALSVQIAREAGYTNAVTTQPGTQQTAGGIMTLHRVRDAMLLP